MEDIIYIYKSHLKCSKAITAPFMYLYLLHLTIVCTLYRRIWILCVCVCELWLSTCIHVLSSFIHYFIMACTSGLSMRYQMTAAAMSVCTCACQVFIYKLVIAGREWMSTDLICTFTCSLAIPSFFCLSFLNVYNVFVLLSLSLFADPSLSDCIHVQCWSSHSLLLPDYANGSHRHRLCTKVQPVSPWDREREGEGE